MSMKAIYVVKGSTGEWDGHHQWLVAAYDDLSKAEIHRARAQEAAEALVQHDLENNRYYVAEPTRYDLNCHVESMYCRYYIDEVLMVSELTDDGLFPGVCLLNKQKKDTQGRISAAVMEKEPVPGSFADKLRLAVKK